MLRSTLFLLLVAGCAGPGASRAGSTPLSEADFALMCKTALFGDDDVRYLRMSGPILEPQIEKILDTWYGFVGGNAHLLQSFTNAAGEPQAGYLAGVRKRFGKWISDTAAAKYDQRWLDYQHEIGLRHHRSKKNRTDAADATDIVHFRYLTPLAVPIVHTLRPFLEQGGHSAAEVDAMQRAWMKSVLLQVTLWSRPYVREGDY